MELSYAVDHIRILTYLERNLTIAATFSNDCSVMGVLQHLQQHSSKMSYQEIYRTLLHMTEEGYLERTVNENPAIRKRCQGRPQPFYSITPKGIEVLQELRTLLKLQKVLT